MGGCSNFDEGYMNSADGPVLLMYYIRIGRAEKGNMRMKAARKCDDNGKERRRGTRKSGKRRRKKCDERRKKRKLGRRRYVKKRMRKFGEEG